MDFLYLVPIALALGVIGLVAFMWALRNGQYEDIDGAAERVLFTEDGPLRKRSAAGPATGPATSAEQAADAPPHALR